MVSVNKTELDFSLILCNSMCDQIFFFFFHSYVASKIETKEEIEEKVTMRLKSLIDGEIEFKFEWR